MKSEKCKEALHKGALLKWDKQGRKPKRDKAKNKTHKYINGKLLKEVITKELLVELYKKKGVSAKEIGNNYGVSESYILSLLKKNNIKVNYARSKHYNGKTLLSILAKEFNIPDRRLKKILIDNDIPFEKKGILSYFDYKSAKNLIKRDKKQI